MSGKSDCTTLSRAVADVLWEAGHPLTEDQSMLLAGALASTQKDMEEKDQMISAQEQIIDSCNRAVRLARRTIEDQMQLIKELQKK